MRFPIDLLQHRHLLRTKRSSDQLFLWCPIRNKWLVQTREEIVRQLLVQHLHLCYHYPLGLVQVEKQLTSHGTSRRFDLLCYQDANHPLLLIECKAPEIELGNESLEQIAIYNYALQVPYLALTNGREMICCSINQEARSFTFRDDLPHWEAIKFD